MINKSYLTYDVLLKELAVENAVEGMVIFDLHGSIIYVNDKLLCMWETEDIGDVIGEDFSHLWDEPQAVAEILKTIQHETTWFGTLRASSFKNKHFEVFVQARVLTYKGRPIGLTATLLDVSIQHNYQEHFRKSEHKFRDLFWNIPTLALACNRSYRIIDASNLFLYLTKYDREQIIGDTIFKLFTRRSAHVLHTLLPSAVQSQVDNEIEVELISKDNNAIATRSSRSTLTTQATIRFIISC